MSYIVFARKYRPQKFDEVIGQDHIISILKKAVETDRIAHAYLFCGPRGVGKTSCARILAKSLNCITGPTINPCGKCLPCKEITGSRSFDVLEIDGASNRGIDEVRSLKEGAKFVPVNGKYKIYIVDEVHMLTTEAFNALLKILEEPPAHVKFFFATTDPNKVPATIISRCQRFDFKRVAISTLIKVLESVCANEGFIANPEALYAVAKAAQGGVRDALSILDQLSALGDEEIKSNDVFSMLGLVEIEQLFALSEAIGLKNSVNAFKVLDQVIQEGKDVRQLLKDLITHFRNLMIIKVGGKSLGKLVDYPIVIKEQLLAQTNHFSLKDILITIEELIRTQDIIKITETLRMPLEIALAKLAYNENVDHHQVVHEVKELRPEPLPSPQQKTEPVLKSEPKIEKQESVLNSNLDIDKIKKDWNALTHAVSKKKMSLATFLQEGSPVEYTDNKLIIGLPKEADFHKEMLEERDNLDNVKTIFSEYLGSNISVVYKLLGQDAIVEKKEEPLVEAALDMFNGKVVQRWHNE